MLFSLFLVALLFCSSFGQPSTSQWTQDQSGDGTYYGGNLQGGHCSIWPVPSFISSTPSIVPVAMNKIDYANSAGCGQCVQIWGTGSGNAVPTTPFIGWVNDECPECAKGSIDLGKSGDGRWGIKWRAVDCPTGSETLSYMFQGSNPWYIKIQVRGHKVPVASIQIANKGSSTFVTLQRQPDNFFTCSGCTYPMVFPLQVKVTSINGQTLVDAIPNLVESNNQPLQGTNKVQFTGIGGGSTPPPTKPPTAPPTAPPTKPPTAPPTAPPTKPPTKPPTAPPTAPPTKPPTKPPTAPPTAAPTGGCSKPSSFSTTQAGSTLTRFDQFINTLTTMEGTVRAVHSSGGAAGGVVSEGQGYGLFIGGATAAALGSSNTDFSRVVARTYEIFLGWQKMCFLSTSDGCQNPRFCQNGANSVPCLPHWKFDDRISSAQGTGSAPDGDEDAILGMILLLKATQGSKPSWWNSVADWAYRSSKQFYESSTAPQGSYRIVKLGACWGGWDCNNPSYHAPAAYRWMRDFMAGYSNEGQGYVAKWDTVISTSYAVLLADQCSTTGLVTNWYVPNANPSVQGSTGCSGSGTPAAEFGSEASRTMFRVALDYIWSGDSRAAQFLSRVVPKVASKFNSGQNLDTGCLVTSIHSGWLDNAFMYGPTLSTLVYPSSSVTDQQSLVNKAGTKLASGGVNDYYSGSWVVISTMVLNGDLAKVGAGCSSPPPPPTGNPTAPPTEPPTKPPTAPPTKPPTSPPTKPPTAPPTAPPTKPPTAPPTTGGSGGSCTGIMYGSDPNNNWWFAISGNPSSGVTVKVECADPSNVVSCSFMGTWGDRYQCQASKECFNDRVAVITQNGATKRCPLDKNKINNARLEGQEDDAPTQGGLPGYAIGLVVVGCVLLGLLIVGAFLVFKMKKNIDPERV